MDSATINYVIYRRHRLMNPMSTDQLARVLAFTDLAAGDKAADLGCGAGFLTQWIASRHQLQITGVERFAPMVERARAAASTGGFRLFEGAAADYLTEAGEHRLLSMLGAIDVAPGLVRPVDIMRALVPSIAPGGWLLWGDPFWRRPPSPRLAMILGGLDRYETLPGWMQAGEQAGLTPHYVSVSSDQDWEEYIWRMNASMSEWADEHAGTPDGDEMRERARILRTLYLEEGRDGAGFGLYLFRRPD
ncbi:MAG: methyltransferase domain-containing protein [Phenylobacterium sp.]|uniref:methyltransferase domain-containing protein n=1 Tax=Phenylobacterium sp. TaxID=1871053 RepID=UPI002736B669|nr:methyltransferase domain-containing protein [Phenylobacterium sp.]MDP3174459.1 methyltransferase domain-containing protein [Phenylobacterium sp.]